MLDILVDLATAAMSFGSVVAAAMYPNGLITIDGVADGGKLFSITFRYDDRSTTDGSNNP